MNIYHPEEELMPARIVREMAEIKALFHIACTRRGARRETAWAELTDQIQNKLWSQHKMHQQELLGWQLRATEKVKESDKDKQIAKMTITMEKWYEEKWKLFHENKSLKEQIVKLENARSSQVTRISDENQSSIRESSDI